MALRLTYLFILTILYLQGYSHIVFNNDPFLEWNRSALKIKGHDDSGYRIYDSACAAIQDPPFAYDNDENEDHEEISPIAKKDIKSFLKTESIGIKKFFNLIPDQYFLSCVPDNPLSLPVPDRCILYGVFRI